MHNTSRYLLGLLLGLVVGVFITIGSGVLADRDDLTETIPFEDLKIFTEVFQRIKDDYVEAVDDKALLENAIQGMLSGLDPHSNYLKPEEYDRIMSSTKGEFGGLGIEVGMEDGFVKVISPIDDTPAQRAGIKAGDMIIRLDDTPVKGMTLNDAVEVMRGDPGTKILLTIIRETEEKPLKIEIVRDIIKIESIKSRLLEPGYGYVRVSHFQARTVEDLNKAIDELKKDNTGDIKGLILDLRNNPGGILKAAVEVSDAFLSEGIIVYTEGRIDDASLKFDARPDDLIHGAPIVVLVNGGSASASEIVAGALQDHKRAVIMGHQTFGKGSVQTILPMNNNAALKLTTARYYTPAGRSIQAEGIEPDIKLNKVEMTKQDEDFNVKEADLARHLENDKENDQAQNEETEGSEKTENLVDSDYAIYEALNLLKGLNIIKQSNS